MERVRAKFFEQGGAGYLAAVLGMAVVTSVLAPFYDRISLTTSSMWKDKTNLLSQILLAMAQPRAEASAARPERG